MDLARSMTPATCSAAEPSTATAMASSHMRMRLKSPMLTQSETAPMVQKSVLFATAPKMNARTKAPPVTIGASCCGATSPIEAPCGRLALVDDGQALLGARRGAAVGILGDQFAQGI